MNGLIYVALGGAIGASCRHLLSLGATRLWGMGYPYGTFAANVLGSFLMGCLAGWLAAKLSGSEPLRLFLGVGLLGGFTTFSAFSLEAVMMYQRKAYVTLIAYASGSVIVSIIALILGLIFMRKALAL